MLMDEFLAALGDEIDDVDEETYDLFSQPSSLPDLGMIDAKAGTLDLSIGGRDFAITQSPGLLQSKREGGTTGAALWQSSVRASEWLSSSTNVLRQHGILNQTSAVLELGSGISGIVPCTIASFVDRVVASDQPYLLKTLRENIAANTDQSNGKSGSRGGKNRKGQDVSIDVLSLDWENDDARSTLAANGLPNGVDAVVACDCIYNYALIPAWVQTCADICKIRSLENGPLQQQPTVCLVVQQLRQSEVFQEWLQATIREFRVWRVPDNLLTSALGEGSGFAVHVGILR